MLNNVFKSICAMWVIAVALSSTALMANEKGFTRTESQAVFDQRDNFAVLVGINEYSYLGNLKWAERDATELANFFDKQGYSVKNLLGYRASAEDILSFVENIAKIVTNDGLEKQGTVVFAFSGHGFRSENGDNYLAMPRTKFNDQGQIITSTALRLNTVREILRDYGVQQRILFIDACREPTETGARAVPASQQGFELDGKAYGEAVLYSTKDRYLAFEDPQLEHGVFTYYLLKGLQGHAASKQDGLVTFDQLKKYVSERVSRHVWDRFEKAQLPYQAGERSALGEFVLARVESMVLSENSVESRYKWLRDEQTLNLTIAQKRQVQRALSSLTINVGKHDGVFGKKTRNGIKTWQEQNDLTVTGYLNNDSYKLLVAELPITEVVTDTDQRATYLPTTVLVEGGKFTQGSDRDGEDDERPTRQVQIKSFEIGKYEVTVGEFRAFVELSGYQSEAERDVNFAGCLIRTDSTWLQRPDGNWKTPGFEQDDNHPVVCVSWNDANAYIDWLNGLTSGGYRLPTESEWEYAARAGTVSSFSFSGNSSTLCNFGNGADRSTLFDWANNCDDAHKFTASVGSFKPNGKQLYDMHGNVWEWVEDCWHNNYLGAPTDGTSWSTGCEDNRRVLRGGSWDFEAENLRSAERYGDKHYIRLANAGFRIARSLER